MNPKTRRIALWLCIVPLALLFSASSFGKLTAVAEPNFIRWGYNITFMYVIGTFEGLGAVGLLVPATRKWAAMGLIGIMIGAAFTHLTHAEYPFVLINLAASVLALGVIRFDSAAKK